MKAEIISNPLEGVVVVVSVTLGKDRYRISEDEGSLRVIKVGFKEDQLKILPVCSNAVCLK